jgi:hypothetical protein
MSTAMAPRVATARARVAALTRSRPKNDPDLVRARAILKEANLEEYVARAVADAPPLSDAQRERIAALLGVSGAPRAPLPSEKDRAEKVEAERRRREDEKRTKAIAAGVSECRGCGRPRVAHVTGEHRFEALTLPETNAVIEAINKKWSN